MGGQEGVRGYLLQAIIATLDSLNKEDWLTVSIEPNSENDKVDIVWTEKDKAEVVYQVKSSINNFEKAEILSWILELVNDSIKAKEFKVVLIGNCSSSTKKFFNNFIDNATEENLEIKFHPLIAFKDKITVEIRTFDLDTFDSAINSKVHKFLSKKNLKLDFSTVELIANGLKVQFLRFSTHGRKMSREDFTSQLLKWIEYNYPSYITNVENELELQFYLTNTLSFSSTLEDNFSIPDFTNLDFVQDKIVSLKTKVKEIDSIKLSKPRKDDAHNKGLNNLGMHGLQKQILSASNQVHASISESEINVVQNLAKDILHLDLTNDFFNTGNLMQPQVRFNLSPFGSSAPSYKGTTSEIKKRNLLDDFFRELKDINDQKNYWKTVGEFRLIPIILRNNGSVLNESVDIQLHFPSNIKIVYPKDFPIPERYNNLKEFNHNDGILSFLLKHTKDSKVKEYNSRVSLPEIELSSLPFSESFEEKKSKETRKYQNLVKSLFDYEIFYDNENKVTLACTIDSIKPNDSISLPCYLFIQNKEGFLINYEINSKNLPSKIVGTLTVNDI